MREPENEPFVKSRDNDHFNVTPLKDDPPALSDEEIDETPYLKIEVPLEVKLYSLHDHILKFVDDMAKENDGDPEWCCNGVEIFKDGCKSGQKDMGAHLLSKCWRSTGEDADFDMCETCV